MSLEKPGDTEMTTTPSSSDAAKKIEAKYAGQGKEVKVESRSGEFGVVHHKITYLGPTRINNQIPQPLPNPLQKIGDANMGSYSRDEAQAIQRQYAAQGMNVQLDSRGENHKFTYLGPIASPSATPMQPLPSRASAASIAPPLPATPTQATSPTRPAKKLDETPLKKYSQGEVLETLFDRTKYPQAAIDRFARGGNRVTAEEIKPKPGEAISGTKNYKMIYQGPINNAPSPAASVNTAKGNRSRLL